MLMVRTFVVFAIFSALLTPLISAQEKSFSEPILTGYITRGTTLTDFDVDGWKVISDTKTGFSQSVGTSGTTMQTPGVMVYLGEHVSIYGEKKYRHHLIEAQTVIFLPPEKSTLNGLAVVDHIFGKDSNGALLLRADGYVIRINPSANIDASSLIKSLNDLKIGDWISYHGTLGRTAILSADKIGLYPSYVSDRESKLITTTDYDAAAVADDAKQSFFSKSLIGANPKAIPPYHDKAMQDRLNHIGQRLIPTYQRELPDTDLRKVHFQFQLVDGKNWKDAWALPSGIILIPHQIVERLQDDSQLATILADNIAEVLEKQGYRLLPATTTLAIVSNASLVGGFFVPGLGLAAGATGFASHKINVDQLNQSGRVSLGLLHDAGYDVTQAPLAWWTLASKPSKTLTETSPPARATNLYKTIGSVWKSYPEQASVPAPVDSTAASQASSSVAAQ